ncbi:uncharacterized protein LOC132301500 [Cornus florida]|uniref:uncharacterized protein LOC132301500 n=1 Tax=Cornus florida TaxID=4283 RepID=UPI0028989B6C|nr:uncharacterized protein LOC132301500 [Cornus florida]
MEQNQPAEQVKRNQKSSHHNAQPVRIINVIHGRPERFEESEDLLRTRLRQAQIKRRIGSVNTLHQQSASIHIKFDRTDLLRVQIPHEDPLVISLTVVDCLVRRVLINPGSSSNVMPRVTFDRLKIKPVELKPTRNPLLGFDGKVQGVPLTLYQVMRCLSPDGNKVIDIHGDQVAAKEYYSVTLKAARKEKASVRIASPR